jgi:hypothetical protein
MADLKPIGSEKLQGAEKIARIMEIARYGEAPKQEINVNETTDYTRVLADGNVYGIVKERNGYIVKKGIDESTLDYIDPMKNRKYHSSYSQALKKLNLIAGELNRLTENEQGTALFGEQKKFVLKTPTSSAPVPAPAPVAPAPEMPVAPSPEPAPAPAPMGDDSMPELSSDDMMPDEMGMDEPTMDEPTMDEPMGPEGVEGDEGPVTLKQVQKLTGKLGQKLRAYASEQEMTSEDVKYVLNSILSAVDLNLLDETDKEDILSRFEEEGEEGSGYDEIGMEPIEPDTSDLDMGDEITAEPEVGESYGYKSKINAIMDGMFTESKVDKILSKYFVETPEEKEINESKKVQTYIKKKINKVNVMEEVKNLSETIEQELTSEFILRENENAKFVGKTNLKNLIFENEGKQIKVSPKGEIL